jgi:hypothetical protein
LSGGTPSSSEREISWECECEADNSTKSERSAPIRVTSPEKGNPSADTWHDKRREVDASGSTCTRDVERTTPAAKHLTRRRRLG